VHGQLGGAQAGRAEGVEEPEQERAPVPAPARPRIDGDGIEWLGEVPSVAEHLRSAALLLLPSRQEGFGIAAAEALACGVPVVAARGERGPEEIAALVRGVALVPARDPDALAGELSRLLADPAELGRLAAAAQADAVARFSWSRTGAETVRAYQDVLQTRGFSA
jgi:glycosyltransferase involved in cell wall biosynthesis